MKTRRRHELKENVLAHELGKIKDFFNRYGNWITGAVVAALIVFLIVWHYRARSARELAEQRNNYETFRREIYEPEKRDSAEAGLIELAENARDPFISALACVDVADFCSSRYADALRRSDAAQTQQYRRKAEKYYRLVIQKHPDRNPFVARAHFGLGMLAENQADWTTARSEYEQVRRLVNSAYPVAIEAQLRLNRLDGWSKPVRFATTEPATAPATTAPATTEPATAPATTEPASAPATTEPASAPVTTRPASKPARTAVEK